MRRFALTLLLVACSSSETGGSGSGGGGSTSALVSGLNVTGLSLYQAVEIPLLPGQPAANRQAPVVVGRPALVRVSVQPESGWQPRPVRARLELESAGASPEIFELEAVIDGPSWRPDLGSTFNLELPGEAVREGLSLRVALEEADGVEHGEASSGARFPAGEALPLEAERSGPLRVVIVPVAYEADGSGRLPELGPEQLERYRQTVDGMFPSAELELRVREPMPWTTEILPTGQGWNELLQSVLSLRGKDRLEGKATPDEYYFALVMPSASFASYCTQSCDLGQSFVADLDEEFLRASVGLGFAGQDSADTFAHELGHTHGRLHSPCGTSGVDADPSFPDPAGGISAWGYDPSTAELFDPEGDVRDFMGYCSPVWISAYNYRALFERIGQVSAESGVPAGSSLQAYRMLSVDRSGAAALGPVLWVDRPLRGKPLNIAVLDRHGHGRWQEARMYRYSHDSGGLVLMAEPRPEDERVRWGEQTLNLR